MLHVENWGLHSVVCSRSPFLGFHIFDGVTGVDDDQEYVHMSDSIRGLND